LIVAALDAFRDKSNKRNASKKNTKRKDPPPPAEEGATDPADEVADPLPSDKKKKKGRV
jgi:hypothetical protein